MPEKIYPTGTWKAIGNVYVRGTFYEAGSLLPEIDDVDARSLEGAIALVVTEPTEEERQAAEAERKAASEEAKQRVRTAKGQVTRAKKALAEADATGKATAQQKLDDAEAELEAATNALMALGD